MNQEELDQEVLECARYGEDEDLRVILQHNGNVNHKDYAGNTALHRASANGHVQCLVILKEFNAVYGPNDQGNTPAHWAAQNAQLEALKFLFDNYPEIDVLVKNEAGRSVLTEAFSSNNRDVIEVCITHSSASEERLLAGMGKTTNNADNGETTITVGDGAEGDGDEANGVHDSEKDSVTHTMQFAEGAVVRVRELPITRADNPFGSEEAPEDDTTGLGIWPASILLSRWVVHLGRNYFQNKVVVELGAGCGLPSLATAVYCGAKSVYVTDIHDPTLNNAAFNLTLNGIANVSGESCEVANKAIQEVNIKTISGDHGEESYTVAKVLKVNWKETESFPEEKADVLLGSDLVYDVKILDLLVPAVKHMLASGKLPFHSHKSSSGA